MLNKAVLESQLAEYPLFVYGFVDPNTLDFTQRVRYICSMECPMYDQSWACPPAVGEVAECKAKCLQFKDCLLISTLTEVNDIVNLEETLSTRGVHEEITNSIAELMKQQGVEPYILSTEACAVCDRCAWLDGQPCQFPERMHPCVESHGINVIPAMEELGIPFISGENVVTWVSLLFF